MSEPSEGASSWLLGTWRSEKERTLKEWLFAEGKAEAMRRILDRDLGKLIHHFTRTLYETYSPFDGKWFRGRYRVAWSNKESVFVVTGPRRVEEGQLIRFVDPNRYWVHTGKNIEYFCRLAPAEAKQILESKIAARHSADA